MWPKIQTIIILIWIFIRLLNFNFTYSAKILVKSTFLKVSILNNFEQNLKINYILLNFRIKPIIGTCPTFSKHTHWQELTLSSTHKGIINLEVEQQSVHFGQLYSKVHLLDAAQFSWLKIYSQKRRWIFVVSKLHAIIGLCSSSMWLQGIILKHRVHTFDDAEIFLYPSESIPPPIRNLFIFDFK